VRLALALLLALLAQAALATQDAWPALYDVTGVAADDVLNVRAAPTAEAEIIGSLAPDATGIEVIAPNDRQDWGRVNIGGRSGWASLRYLQREPGQWYGRIPPIRTCAGTEPFWSLSLQGDGTGLWATPEGKSPARFSTPVGSENHRGHSAWRGKVGTETLTVTVRHAACSDGMSDQHFGLQGDLLFSGPTGVRLYTGCCSLAP
jgi:uncharacterized protein YgiM (DUF1202 family)